MTAKFRRGRSGRRVCSPPLQAGQPHVIIDNNGLQIDGDIAKVMSPYPIDKKLEAFGFHVETIDGHDFDAIASALDTAKTVKGRPQRGSS